MESAQEMVKTTLGEMERVLSTKTVFGDPMTFDGKTIIPLIAIGFAFGAGSGSGSGKAEEITMGEGTGGGAGGGVGIKPVGIIIIDSSGIRIEPVKAGIVSAMEKFGEMMPQMMEKMQEMWMKKHGEHHGGQKQEG